MKIQYWNISHPIVFVLLTLLPPYIIQSHASQSAYKECDASIILEDYQQNNAIEVDLVFEVTVSACKLSSGRFDFTFDVVNKETGKRTERDRGLFWENPIDHSPIIEVDKLSLNKFESFSGNIQIDKSTIKCVCMN